MVIGTCWWTRFVQVPHFHHELVFEAVYMVIESEPGYVNNLIQAVLAFTEKMKLSC